MTVTVPQRAAIEEIIQILTTATPPRSKRQLAGMFLQLVNRAEWPQYYELIPEPRCINNIKTSLEKNRYKDPLDAYTDLALVFWNAMFYNEPDSQIFQDAEILKTMLQTEWSKRTVLPYPKTTSPPPSSAQKVHAPAAAAAPKTVASSKPITAPTPLAPPRCTATPMTQHVASPAPTLEPPAVPKSLTRNQLIDMDVDVDVGGSPEPEGQVEDLGADVGMERDPASEEIIKQLEKGLPKWEGFSDEGWMTEVTPERLIEIIHAIKIHKDIIGNRLAGALEAVPEDSSLINLSCTVPLSFKLIESRTRAKSYESAKEFDKEMIRLFEKARRWYEPCTEPYGRVVLLQRFYQALTSAVPPAGPPYTSQTNFCSLRAGPGNAKPLHTAEGEGVAGVTTFRVSAKDRTFVEEAHYKGLSVRLADWVHLSNPDDASRPIVAQVFKVWVSEDPTKAGEPGLTVCWYHRPEQTFHPAHRKFWEGEVFKTSHFADHSLADLIEKIAVQFTARHIRGRPRPPFWYPGWPLYMCDSRYNDRERVFVKIKNWNSCVPEEVRKSTEFMPIYPFERMVFPRKVGSPFLSPKVGAGAGVAGGAGAGGGAGKVTRGPGGIGENVEKGEGERVEGGGTGRKRPRRNAAGTDGGETSAAGRAPLAGVSAAYTPSYQYQPALLSQQHAVSRSAGDDRSIAAAAGVPVHLSTHATVYKLPPETTKHFDRDPTTNEVLWFAGPPMNIARPQAAKHSLTYLHFLAMKRKRAGDTATGDPDTDEGVATAKRPRNPVPMTATETLRSLVQEYQAQSVNVPPEPQSS